MGYPGRLTLTVTYALNNRSDLGIHYHATTSKDTVFNPTNHSYSTWLLRRPARSTPRK